MRENFSTEQQIKQAVVPLIDGIFLADFLKNEKDIDVKKDEVEFVEYLNKLSELERLFGPLTEESFVSEDKDLKSGPENVGVGTYVCDDVDYRHTTHSTGWPKYWVAKLLKNLDKIPEDVRRAVLEISDESKKSGAGMDILTSYVNRIYKEAFQKRMTGEYSERRTNKQVRLLHKLQSFKENVLVNLKKRLVDLDHQEYREHDDEPKRFTISVDNNGKYFTELKDGTKKYMTEGDIVADMTWGTKYKVSNSVEDRKAWRRLNKIIDIHEARQKISQLYDEEFRSRGFSVGESSARVYKKIKSGESINKGILSEYFTYSLIKRMQYQEDMPIQFRIERPNAIEDTKLKYDLKIFIYIGDSVFSYGFQLSTVPINQGKKDAISKGEARIKSGEFGKYVKRVVDEIIPLHLSSKYSEAYNKWRQAGRLPGGPEAYLPVAERRKIVFKIFSSIPIITNEGLTKIMESFDKSENTGKEI